MKLHSSEAGRYLLPKSIIFSVLSSFQKGKDRSDRVFIKWRAIHYKMFLLRHPHLFSKFTDH